MDPDECLARIGRLLVQIRQRGEVAPAIFDARSLLAFCVTRPACGEVESPGVRALREAADDLDNWIRRGGFLPTAWQVKP